MAIQSGEVRLVKSKVMLDTPEGGGGPTGIAIEDGRSNDVFPDVSALDRVNGRVNLRQLHLHVSTPGTEMYLGANAIVSRPPNDPNISVTLMDTGATFDTRADAISRAEAYLFVGSNWPGQLFGNHLAGMRVITIIQRSAEAPTIGATLALTKREGYADEYRQYVRVTAVSVVLRTFEDGNGLYDRNVLELELSDPLRSDFPGFNESRYEQTTDALRLRTNISKTVVANAARYYGVVDLAQAAHVGDMSARLASIFTQLVPSAQVETPILDARTNQMAWTSLPAGGMLTETRQIAQSWGPANPRIFIGGGVTPGTLHLATSGRPTVTDDGAGLLIADGLAVGTIDYANGTATATGTANLWDGIYSAVPFQVTYKPTALVETISQTQGFPVTAANRSLNVVRTIEPVPVAGTLAVDYRSQGNWYTLQDDGSGALRGTDASFGAGVLNRSSGTVAVTFGALPDVDSAVIFRWSEPGTEVGLDALRVSNDGKLAIAINSDGVPGRTPGRAIEPGTLVVTWSDGGSTRTVTDDGAGRLTGYGTGVVAYAQGWVMLSPTTLPAKGTMVQISSGKRTPSTAAMPTSSSGGTTTIDMGGPVEPGSVAMAVAGQPRFSYKGGASAPFGDASTYRLTDDGTGRVLIALGASFDQMSTAVVGSIDYTSGLITLNSSVPLTGAAAAAAAAFINIYELWWDPTRFIIASGPSGG